MRENRPYSLSGGRRSARKRASSDPTPAKQPNKTRGDARAEVAEGRALTEENNMEPNNQPTQSGVRVSQGLDGVRERARKNKQERFTALLTM